jgi:hypothetical protein
VGIGVGAGAALGTTMGWFYSGVLLATHRELLLPERVLRVAGDVVTLAGSRLARQPGVWGLRTADALGRIGPVLADRGAEVDRSLTGGDRPAPGPAVLDAGPFDPDPAARGLVFTEVAVPTPLGPAPAWHVPAGGDTWVVAVHGRGATRRESLRSCRRCTRWTCPSSWSATATTGTHPRARTGVTTSGTASGSTSPRPSGSPGTPARGGSCSTAGRWVGPSPAPTSTAACTPPTSPPSCGTRRSSTGAPPSACRRATAASHRGSPRWRRRSRAGASASTSTASTCAAAPRPSARRPCWCTPTPTPRSPVQASRDLAAAAPRLDWPLRYVEVPDLEHTAAWNADPAAYEDLVTGFLRATL